MARTRYAGQKDDEGSRATGKLTADWWDLNRLAEGDIDGVLEEILRKCQEKIASVEAEEGHPLSADVRKFYYYPFESFVQLCTSIPAADAGKVVKWMGRDYQFPAKFAYGGRTEQIERILGPIVSRVGNKAFH